MSLQPNATATYYVLTTNVTAYILRSYNLMVQPIYYVLTIQCYSLYTTFLQSNVTAYIFQYVC